MGSRRRAWAASAGVLVAGFGIAGALTLTGGNPRQPARALAAEGRQPTTTTTTTIAAPSATTATTAPPPTTMPAPPYQVAASTITLVDPSRPTPARGSVPASSDRVLRTLIRKPVGANGPLPVVVFGHGFDVTPETYEPLLDAWAAAGYLVAAPDFPGSASDHPGAPTESDIPEQARDMSFVLDTLLSGGEGPIDTAHVAAAGHSDGGSTVVVLAEQPEYTDRRFDAYLVLAGQIPDGVAGPWNAPTPGTLLAMVGSDDQYGNLQLTRTAYDADQGVKAMVVVPGGDHLQLFVGSGPLSTLARELTLRYLQAVFAPGASFTESLLSQALAARPGDPTYQLTIG